MKNHFKLLFCILLCFYITLHSFVYSQCTLPGGAIQITQASFGAVATVGSGICYYVPPATVVSIDHSSSNLTAQGGGKILVMGNAILNLSMGSAKNMTINGGIIQLCDGARVNINPGHDLTMQGSTSLIQLGVGAHMDFCSFGHDLTFNAGTIQMNDYASIEFGDFHNLIINATNMVTFSGSASNGISNGNPIFHIGGTDFVNNVNTSNMASNLTTSNHIDFVNDAYGSDRPGSANYCGPKNAGSYPTCRSQWGAMDVYCGAAAVYQTWLPIHLISFGYKEENSTTNLSWKIADQTDLDHFELERSSVSDTFNYVASVPTNLNNQSTNDYSYLDSKPIIVDTKYRLKLVGKDGKIGYSSIILIHPDITNSPAIIFFPNPFSDHLQMNTIFSESVQVKVEIFVLWGNKVKEFPLNVPAGYSVSDITNVSYLAPGNYLIKITTPEKSYYQQLVKMK